MRQAKLETRRRTRQRMLAFILAASGWHSLGMASETDWDVTFRDVTSESGIDFLHTNGRAGELYVIEVKGSGVAFLDYDNDDDLDLYAVNGNNLPGAVTEVAPINRLYRNNGDGTFTEVTDESRVGDGGYGHGAAVADYDNDGDQDIYVANYGSNVLYRNNGDGTFTDVTRDAGVAGDVWSASAAFCDLDNDGLLDLYVANYLVFDIESTVRLPTGPGFYDGEVDVLYLNNGDGTFRDVTADNIGTPNGKGLGVVCFDYDGDGDQEIYVANDGVENLMYENQGGAVFSDVTLFSGTGVNGAGETEAGMGVDAGDYDNDGDLDLFVTNYKGESNTLMRNDGGGIFTDATSQANLVAASLPYVTFGTGFFDPDNDGDLDIFVANGHTEEDEPDHEQPDQLFENLGTGRYRDASSQSGAPFQRRYVGRGVAFGDFDNDGDIDLVVSNKNGPLTLLQNSGGNQHNWLLIRTVGTESNRDGIGSKIEVTAPEFKRTKEVKTSYSMFSSNDPRTHFGLGEIEKVDVTIRWPSGTVDTLTGIPANKLITVVEGSGKGVLTDLRPMETAYGDGEVPSISATPVDSASIEDDMSRLRTLLDGGSDDAKELLSLGPSLIAWLENLTDKRFREVLSANSQNVAYLKEFGLYLQSRVRLGEAIDTFDKASVLEPDSMEIHAALAALRFRAGRFDDAVSSARRAMELGDPGAAVYLLLGESLMELQKIGEAEEALLALIDRYPRFFEGYLRLGRLYADSDRLDLALEAYKTAVKLESSSREARYQLADVYRRAGNGERYEYHMRVFSLLETETALFKGGMSREDEIDLILREIRMNPLFGRTRADRQLALRYGELGDLENQELYSVRGRLSTLKDAMESAIDALRRLVDLEGSEETRSLFADLVEFRKRVVDAFNRAAGYDAVASAEFADRGEKALAAGEFDAALAAFREALLENPDNAAAYRGLARVYHIGGLGVGPARSLAHKAALVDQSPESYALLAEIYAESGEKSAARQASSIASRN